LPFVAASLYPGLTVRAKDVVHDQEIEMVEVIVGFYGWDIGRVVGTFHDRKRLRAFWVKKS